jgi:hypothetical protein
MAAHGPGGQNLDPGTRLILGELRDLRLEMRADRRQTTEERRRSDGERRQADQERRQADQERRQADQERRRADEEWRQGRLQADEERRQERLRSEAERRQEKLQSDERFQQVMRDFRQDSARREAATQKAFKDIRMVGLSIVRTLNHHTRILQRIERTLGARGHGRPGQDNGRRA